MMISVLLLGAIAQDNLDTFLSNSSSPGIALLAASGGGGLYFTIRWMIKYQKEFTDFYMAENRKLRERIDALEAEILAKDSLLVTKNQDLLDYETESRRLVFQLEDRIRDHEALIRDLQQQLK